MKQLFRIAFLLVCLMAGMECNPAPSGTSVTSIRERISAKVLSTASHHSMSDTVRDATPSQRTADAILTDAQSVYRICSSRPQRTLTIHGSRNNRMQDKQVLPYIKAAQNSYGRKRVKPDTSPFCTLTPGQYCVVALRHILR